MHLVVQSKYNSAAGKEAFYYRIKESYRNARGNVCVRILLNVGFIDPRPTPEQWRMIIRLLNERMEQRRSGQMASMFPVEADEYVRELVEKFWQEMIDNGKIDSCDKAKEAEHLKLRSMIDAETVKHREAREVGGESLCLQAIEQLGIADFLKSKGWSEEKIRYTIAHLIVRCLYSPSENKSIDIMLESSAVCELLGIDLGEVTRYKTYKVAPELYALKEALDRFLCQRTDTLFNLTNKIVLFDLTNFYYEGRKDGSSKAAFGRSKEKRSDCKLEVLGLCINKEGFIRHSELLAGNTADPKALPSMVKTLQSHLSQPVPEAERTLVVMDAGIATEENLALLKESGFNYLCVCRRKLGGKDYRIKSGSESVTVQDCKGRDITLTRIERSEDDGDWYLRIDSPAKAIKEESMQKSMRQRYEDGLKKIAGAIEKKGGTKRYEKVWERIGRLNNEYPSISRHYTIEVEKEAERGKKKDNKGDKKDENKGKNKDGKGNGKPANASRMTWTCHKTLDDTANGVYFMRTNVPTLDEKTTWDYYNLIREIECTNRQLKTDLALRPIHHQTDAGCDAHLYLGLLAYWVVNTIRYQLKLKGEKMYWTEIVRIMSTQKAVTTEAVNGWGEQVEYRICTIPTAKAQAIYDKLKYRRQPFRKKQKICSTPSVV